MNGRAHSPAHAHSCTVACLSQSVCSCYSIHNEPIKDPNVLWRIFPLCYQQHAVGKQTCNRLKSYSKAGRAVNKDGKTSTLNEIPVIVHY